MKIFLHGFLSVLFSFAGDGNFICPYCMSFLTRNKRTWFKHLQNCHGYVFDQMVKQFKQEKHEETQRRIEANKALDQAINRISGVS